LKPGGGEVKQGGFLEYRSNVKNNSWEYDYPFSKGAYAKSIYGFRFVSVDLMTPNLAMGGFKIILPTRTLRIMLSRGASWWPPRFRIRLKKPEHSMPSKRLPLQIELKKPEHSIEGLSKMEKIGHWIKISKMERISYWINSCNLFIISW